MRSNSQNWWCDSCLILIDFNHNNNIIIIFFHSCFSFPASSSLLASLISQKEESSSVMEIVEGDYYYLLELECQDSQLYLQIVHCTRVFCAKLSTDLVCLHSDTFSQSCTASDIAQTLLPAWRHDWLSLCRNCTKFYRRIVESHSWGFSIFLDYFAHDSTRSSILALAPFLTNQYRE